MVQTVLGNVDCDKLGRTLIHEHLFARWPGAEMAPANQISHQDLVEICVTALNAIRDQNVKTFVDPNPIELGRDIHLMADVSRRTGINIIFTTGFYYEAIGLPYFWKKLSAAEIADFYVDEIVNGVGRTGIRPGAIKCATGKNPTEMEEKFIEAASRAHRRTGVPIITHTTGGLGGPYQQELFARFDVAPHHCLIGHCCDSHDPAYHKIICEGGSYIGFDRPDFAVAPEVSADNVAKLVKGGYVRQIMLSNDRCCVFQGQPTLPFPELGPTPHTYLIEKFLPMLRERDVSESAITTMLEENPYRFFSGEAF